MAREGTGTATPCLHGAGEGLSTARFHTKHRKERSPWAAAGRQSQQHTDMEEMDIKHPGVV